MEEWLVTAGSVWDAVISNEYFIACQNQSITTSISSTEWKTQLCRSLIWISSIQIHQSCNFYAKYGNCDLPWLPLSLSFTLFLFAVQCSAFARQIFRILRRCSCWCRRRFACQTVFATGEPGCVCMCDYHVLRAVSCIHTSQMCDSLYDKMVFIASDIPSSGICAILAEISRAEFMASMLSQMTHNFDSDIKEKRVCALAREMRIFARKKLAPDKSGFRLPIFLDWSTSKRGAFNSKTCIFRGMTNFFTIFRYNFQRRILTISTQIRNQKLMQKKKKTKNKQTKQRTKEKKKIGNN